MNKLKLTPTQKIVLKLIQDDMKFIYNVIKDMEARKEYNFTIALLPYMALVYKESYKWCKKIKELKKSIPINIPNEIELYSEYYREYNKLLKNDIITINNNYEYQFNKTKNYFEKNRSNFSKKLGIYKTYGVGTYQDSITKKLPIYNTIYFSILIPKFSWDNLNETSKDLYRIAEHIGKFFGIFLHPYEDRLTNNITSIKIVDYDFGPRTSPFQNEYSDKFLIFDLLCKCNFVLYGLNNFTSTLLTTKLRFSYNLYFYICESIDKINNYYNTDFTINNKYKDDELRSAFMHYGIWKIVKDKVDPLDSFGGMTNISLDIEWNSLLIFTLSEIKSFSLQLDNYLSKNKLSHNFSIFNKDLTKK